MDPKKILIAVDASDNAARAVTYVAELLGGSAGFQIIRQFQRGSGHGSPLRHWCHHSNTRYAVGQN